MKTAIKLLKSKYFWMAVYVLSLVSGFLYISSVLKTGTVDVTQQQVKKKAVEIKEARVSLVVEMPTATVTYDAKITNADTVLDLLETLRKTTSFKYQLTSYVDRIDIDFVNGIYPPKGYKWKVFSGSEDITQKFQNVYLQNRLVYTVKLVKE